MNASYVIDAVRTPSAIEEPLPFIEEVDKRLYRAKVGGRNALVSSAG